MLDMLMGPLWWFGPVKRNLFLKIKRRLKLVHCLQKQNKGHKILSVSNVNPMQTIRERMEEVAPKMYRRSAHP